MNSEQEKVRIEKLNYRLPQKLTAILDGFKWAIHEKNTSAVLVIDGRSGLGKSTLASQIGLYVDPNFSLDNFYFEPEEFIKGLTEARVGTCLIFDEAMLLSSRAALSQINKMVIIAMSMIRSKRLMIIFCVNSLFDLDRNLALSRADLILHVYGESLTDRGKFMAFFKGADGYDRIKALYLLGKKFYNYSKPKSNFFSRFSSRFTVDEKEYDDKKNEGINRFLSGSSKKLLVEKERRSRDNYIIYLRKLGTPVTEIARIGELSRNCIYDVFKSRGEP